MVKQKNQKLKLLKEKTKQIKAEAKKIESEGKARSKVIVAQARAKKIARSTEKENIKRREKAVRGILSATGVIQGGQRYSGPGRPRGVYKYGVPIQVYKAQQREKKALYQQYQQEQYAKLKTKGFTPEQVQQLQQQQALQELEQPTVNQVRQERIQRIQSNVQQMQQPVQVIRQPGYGRIIPRSQRIQPGRSVADEELDFRKWSAETTISPNTQRLLDRVRRIQNKGKFDNIEMQRRLRERDMLGRSMNLMKAHENMIDTRMDFTGVDASENILMAPSVFKENPQNNILRNNRGSLGILNTRDAGNNLKFF